MSPLRKISVGLSWVVACGYVAFALQSGMGPKTVGVLLFLVLPLACLRWPDEIGAGTNKWLYPGGWNVTAPSPPLLLQATAWFMLLSPFLWWVAWRGGAR